MAKKQSRKNLKKVSPMQYYILVEDESDERVAYVAAVPEEDAAYVARVAATLRPMSDDQYMHGPAAVLQTFAPYSYVLEGDAVYWCAEWGPGLIVVRFCPGGSLAWTALRSPVPDFGGREASESDWADYDEDAENPQYNLVFDAWDAQFDRENREWKSFVPADEDAIGRFDAAISHVNELGESLQQRYGDDRDPWLEFCKQNLEQWAGDGVRLE